MSIFWCPLFQSRIPVYLLGFSSCLLENRCGKYGLLRWSWLKLSLSVRDFLAAVERMLLLFLRLIPSVTLPVISTESILLRMTDLESREVLSLSCSWQALLWGLTIELSFSSGSTTFLGGLYHSMTLLSSGFLGPKRCTSSRWRLRQSSLSQQRLLGTAPGISVVKRDRMLQQKQLE